MKRFALLMAMAVLGLTGCDALKEGATAGVSGATSNIIIAILEEALLPEE